MTRIEPNLEELELPSRYVVGIDLGTTNSAVCYVDTSEQPWQVRTFAVPQLVDAGVSEARETLPSFHYQPASGELSAEALRLAWHKDTPSHAVGFFARDQGSLVPGRLIASAKSWLCHSGVDRTAELLPWRGAADVERLSPVEVSSRYLQHIRDAWDARFANEPLAKQDIVLTLPASFDEVARELTVEAAARAGLPRVVLIEEPQAAFYAWIYKHADDWEQHVEEGQKILVCDIGGGTSDFTLIRVRHGEGQKIQFHRVAVGEHLILGGDNLDLALAQHIEYKLCGERKLEPRQWDVLVRNCRQAKETLLGGGAPEKLTVNLPGTGSRLIGGGLQAEVTRDELGSLLVDGFFPPVSLDDKPVKRRSGFQEFGLPFAADAAVTRYLAAFLTAHRHVGLDDEKSRPDLQSGHSIGDSESDTDSRVTAGLQIRPTNDPARPDIVLFNGGMFESPVIRQRLLDVLCSWFRAGGASSDWAPRMLDNDRLDMAVARGAAYYGMVRRGEGVRIAAGLARTYYIGVEGEQPSAVCLVPGSAEPGQEIDLTQRRFNLLISEPAEFPLYVSSTRLADRPGELFPVDREQMTSLPPIRTVLRTRRRSETGTVSVNLHARLTEIGTLDLWCSEVDGERSWRLQFDIRSATQTDIEAQETAGEQAGFLDEATWQKCCDTIAATFGSKGDDKPESLVKRLVEAAAMDRHEWPTTLLRRVWEALMDMESGRRKSAVHEARWLNLLGYALRPGYGLAVDDWRVAETWRHVQGKLAFASPACRTESLILWRRVAGGLSAGQQRAVAEPLLAPVRGLHRRLTTGQGRGGDGSFGPHEAAEVWRLLGSLELLSVDLKLEMGNILAELLPKRKLESIRPALCWALGRIGQRVPLYGPLNTVVPVEAAQRWLGSLLELNDDDPMTLLAVMQLARKTDDRYRDVSDKVREQVLGWLDIREAPEHLVELVRAGGQLDTEEQGRVFGEALPKGLRII